MYDISSAEDPAGSVPRGRMRRRVKLDKIDFPSDSLSIKRLRTIHPESFDEGNHLDGFGDYFFPMWAEKPAHLVHLTDMLSAERILAEYAFLAAIWTKAHGRIAIGAQQSRAENWSSFI